MEGVPDDENLRGVTPNSFHHIFSQVAQAGSNTEFLVRMTFLEIYKEEVFDLLNKEDRVKMDVKEDTKIGAFVVPDLSEYVAKSPADMMKILKRGQKARKVGATNMNAG